MKLQEKGKGVAGDEGLGRGAERERRKENGLCGEQVQRRAVCPTSLWFLLSSPRMCKLGKMFDPALPHWWLPMRGSLSEGNRNASEKTPWIHSELSTADREFQPKELLYNLGLYRMQCVISE